MRPSPSSDSQLASLNVERDSRAVAALKTAVQDGRTIFDCVQEAIAIHDIDGTVLDVNKQLLALFDVTREEALSYRLDREYATEKSPVRLLPKLWQDALNGESVTVDWPAKRPSDNSQLYLSVTMQRVVLSHRERVMVSVRDVTWRKQAEVEQRRLLSILEATPDLVGISDIKGQCLYLNSAGREIIGLAEDAPVGFHIDETMSEKERERFVEVALPQAIEHGSYCCESSLVTRMGEERPVSRVLIAHKDEAGKVDCLSAVMRDIRGLKAVEEKLRDREQFLSSIYEGANIAIFAWDLVNESTGELRCSGWNPTCEAATGIRADAVIGKTPYDVFGEQQGALVAQNNLRCAEKKHPISYEEELVVNGESTWWATKLTPIQDPQGHIYRVVGTTNNITKLKLNSDALEAYSKRQAQQAKALATALAELRHTQAQIIQNEKMSSLGEMVAGIAHEINNPVNFIHANIRPAMAYTGDLITLIKSYQQEYPAPSAEIADMLDELDFEFIQKDFLNLLSSMKVGTHRIREIVLSLRNFSRLDEAEVKAVNLQDGIDSTLVILSHKLRDNATRGTIEIIKSYQTMPLVECYPSQLNQVVMNIVANAIDAVAEVAQPQITIATQVKGRNALVAISDNGVGMPDSVQDRVFNPFYTTKPVGEGTGMGLSVSYQIVTKKHGGQLSVKSAVGEGTTFLIEIPLKQAIAE